MALNIRVQNLEGREKMTNKTNEVTPKPPPENPRRNWEPAWWVKYTKALGAGLGALAQVTIRDQGRVSTLRLTANLPSRQQIGFFRIVLPETEVNRLQGLVRASNYLSHGHQGFMEPDTPTISLRERDDVSTFIPDTIPPKSVLDVFSALDQVAEEIVKHPYKTLSGEAQWKAPEFKRGEHVEMTVALRSVGSELIVIDNPLRSTSRTWVGLRLTVAREKPQSDLDWEKDVKRIDLVPQDLLTAEGKLAKDQNPRIELPSGAELRILIRRKLLLSEGRYRGSLTFTGASDPLDGTVVGGSLTMDLGPMTVVR
jgi:hypothetical protein